MNIRSEPTGERVIEDAYQNSTGGYFIYLMHIASYNFAENFCGNKQILDLGCGSGYGSARIAKIAEYVEAVDVAGDAIDFAKSSYRMANLKFRKIDHQYPLPFEDASFDVILSFQVIEHVHNEKVYLQEARRVLKPSGTIIIITPDRKHRLLPIQKPWNRWHIREYSRKELESLIRQFFSIDKNLLMGAQKEYANIELRRYRITKILTLPFTLKFLPEAWRRAGLNFLQALKNIKSSKKYKKKFIFNFDERVIEISDEVEYSLNLVFVAKKSHVKP